LAIKLQLIKKQKIIFMQTFIFKWRSIAKAIAMVTLVTALGTSCQKQVVQQEAPIQEPTQNEQLAANKARELEQSVPLNANKQAASVGFTQTSETDFEKRQKKNIVEIAIANPHFSSLVAAVVKTGLADALSNSAASLTVFAPTNEAFAQLPAPFNNAENIAAITDAANIDFLKSVLLYHVLGKKVKANHIEHGRSSAETLKPAGSSNDNTLYFSKTFGFIRINGSTDVIFANIKASNGVIHVINKVLLFPTKTIAEIAVGDPDNFSVLVSALAKANLVSVFTGSGNFTVFAPTNAAFAQLPAPFNNSANITAISDPAQIAALANILKYHVVASRNFAWDLGIFRRVTTLADAPKNKVTTILGYNSGWVRGDGNNMYSKITPADVLATNGVIQVIDKVLLPK
jgi:transforming growth factor-beta-induced protein